VRNSAIVSDHAARSRSRPRLPRAGKKPIPNGGAPARGSRYVPCISNTEGTPAASAPDSAAGISVSTTTTSAGSRSSSSTRSRQNCRAGPNITRSRTRANIPSGVRASQSLTRSVSARRTSLSGACRYTRKPAPADSNRLRSPSVPSTRTWWPRATARRTTVWTASTPPPLSHPATRIST